MSFLSGNDGDDDYSGALPPDSDNPNVFNVITPDMATKLYHERTAGFSKAADLAATINKWADDDKTAPPRPYVAKIATTLLGRQTDAHSAQPPTTTLISSKDVHDMVDDVVDPALADIKANLSPTAKMVLKKLNVTSSGVKDIKDAIIDTAIRQGKGSQLGQALAMMYLTLGAHETGLVDTKSASSSASGRLQLLDGTRKAASKLLEHPSYYALRNFSNILTKDKEEIAHFFSLYDSVTGSWHWDEAKGWLPAKNFGGDDPGVAFQKDNATALRSYYTGLQALMTAYHTNGPGGLRKGKHVKTDIMHYPGRPKSDVSLYKELTAYFSSPFK